MLFNEEAGRYCLDDVDDAVSIFAPVDAPAAVEAFLGYWKPNAIILIESELWPNLIISAAKDGSNQQAIQFQLLQAPPLVINFSGDLKYAVEDTTLAGDNGLEELQEQLKHRKVWMASSLHRGEDKILLRVHKALKEIYPDMLTIIVPRHLEVSGDMLVEALIELFSDAKLLETRRAAAKQAYHALSSGVVENMWRLVQFHILDKSVPM